MAVGCVLGFLLLRSVIGRAGDAVTSPTVIASAVADFDGDGYPDTLEIVQISGRQYVDETAWCGMSPGGERKVEGRFVVRVRLHGKPEVDTDLSELFQSSDLWFMGTGWKIYVASLTRAAGRQFTLGQYGACRSWSYYVFGVSRDGRVESLSPELLNGDRRNSTELQRTARGFVARTIPGSPDAAGGCVEYRWSRKTRTFLPAVAEAQACD